MSPTILAILGLLVWIGVSVGLGFLLGLKDSTLYIFIGLLTALGIVAAGIYIWWSGKRAALGGGPASGPSGDPEIDALAKDAEGKLSASRAVPGAKIGNLPLVFLMGEHGSVKTTSLVNSGLEPELVTGFVYQDNNIVPTRLGNLFLAKQTLFFDAGGDLMLAQPRWQKLLRKLAPGQLKSVVGGQKQAPRSAVVCFDVERFFQPGGLDAAVASARNLNQRLGDIAQQLGISFPVYVVFTRMDRMPFFHDWVQNLANEETLQVFGATVPLRPANATAIYADEATRSLSELFNNLNYSINDKRLLFLPRENDPAKLPGAYEFAREFRKLRGPLVQFLVELCRPSQLRTSPFLRGFYFSGVRPVVVDDSANLRAAQQQHQSALSGASGATSIFKVGPGGTMGNPGLAGTPQIGATKRVPQWTFLGRLFNDIILGDHDALAASSASTKTSTLQRILLATVAVISLIGLIGGTLSWLNNRELQNATAEAAKAIVPLGSDAKAVPEPVSLENLDKLRQTLLQLEGYQKDGAPYSLRWGLYQGDAMLPEVRTLYCTKLSQQLVGPMLSGLRAQLRALPLTPTPNDDYGANFGTLRTYLTAVAYPEKAVKEVTAPAMLAAWQNGRSVDEPRLKLAKAQFDFYADLLKTGGCPASYDGEAVSSGRRFLAQFSGQASIYQSMLAAANRAAKGVNFNRDIAGSAAVVVNSKDIAGAFTQPGYEKMAGFIKNPDPFFGGEKWVLCGEPGNAADRSKTTCDSSKSIDRGQLIAWLTDTYTQDYINAWRGYFRASSVVKYADLEDAAKKLDILSSNTTPLLALFWMASQNTSVDNEKIRVAFQSSHEVVPPPAKEVKYLYAEKTGSYVENLLRLQQGVTEAAAQKGNVDVANATVTIASSARVSAKGVASRFNPDPSGGVDAISARLLEDPITQVERFLRGAGKDELNSKGAGMCRALSPIFAKFPFNPAAKAEVTLDELAKLIRPTDSELVNFYNENLRKYVKKENGMYVLASEAPGPIQINPQFLKFFNDAMRFGDMLYPQGAQSPQLKYTLTPIKTEVLNITRANIDGQSIAFSGPGQSKQVRWPGSGGAQIYLKQVNGGGEVEGAGANGLWAIFRVFTDADFQNAAGTNTTLEWVMRKGGKSNEYMMIDGKEARYKFQVDVPVFTKAFFNSMRCVSTVAK